MLIRFKVAYRIGFILQNERENVKKTILISLNSGDRVRLGYTISGEGSTVFPANTSNVVLKRIDS